MKDGNKVINEKNIAGINKEILIAKNKDNDYYDMIFPFYSDKKSLITYLNNFIKFYQRRLKTGNYSDEAKIKINRRITKDNLVINELANETDFSYKKYQKECHFLKNDYIKYKERKKLYFKDILKQMELSVLFYKQDTTKNFMDYYNSGLFYTQNQIKVMRDDSINFIEEFCKCKVPTKKK
jgi:hypothetical protein